MNMAQYQHKMHPCKAKRLKKLKWLLNKAWRNVRAWKRSMCREQRELDAFRRCVWLERRAMEHPRAVPLLMELMQVYRATGQEERRLETMRRLRDLDPLPVPDFMWDEEPSAKVLRHNIRAWCAQIERIVKERRLDSLHLQRIRDILHVSRDNAEMVADALECRGLLGPYDMALGARPVLVKEQ